MSETTKRATDLASGDRVRMADDTVRTVAKVSKGFATVKTGDGRREGTVIIDWRGGYEFSQVARSQPVTVLP